MEEKRESVQRTGAICDPAPIVQISANQCKNLIETQKEAAKQVHKRIQSVNEFKSAVEIKDTVLLCTDLYV